MVGAGHAGVEAALAAARLGARTLLLTINNDHVAQMSCNPAIGGIAKGQVVREIDALGGEMGRTTDVATIQFRMLNQSKGPAVRSPRAQCDKLVYQRRMKHVLERQDRLRIQQAEVVELTTDRKRVTGVRTEFGEAWSARAVVLATGTFLDAKLHYGLQSFSGGRAGDPAARALAAALPAQLGLELGRLKTGTPPRVLAGTIDLASLQRQDPDPDGGRFSYRAPARTAPHPSPGELPQCPCCLTASTAATARIIRANLHQSPLYSGRIDGTGPRYCPSFEDKIIRFPDRKSHQIYLEPEGVFTDEYYLNGFSTSLPPPVQWQMVRSLPGLEQAHISRYAYAIEYAFVLTHQIDTSLAVRRWPNLFLAGQINGTSGYEEAAGQGLLAGINAARLALGSGGPITLSRDCAYIGVMIDDLATKEIVEPYRLFTSRAEYRLLLRQDNADLRLAALGREIGLLPAAEYRRTAALANRIAELRERLQNTRHEGRSLWEWLRQPGMRYTDLAGCSGRDAAARVREQLEIEARYEGYVRRQLAQADGMRQLDKWRVPDGFDYSVPKLRLEARAKLEQRRPRTLGQAARIDGVTPAEIALLQVHLRRCRNDP